jgi:predicted dehydrogenase
LEGPYGRCVYDCDNDVVDHQIVMMEFEDGISVNLTMQGHAHFERRVTDVHGSRGSLHAVFGLEGSWIETWEHRSGKRSYYPTSSDGPQGHGGGDDGLMRSFIQSVGRQSSEDVTATALEALESHLLAFAAEDARLGDKWISLWNDA